MIDDNFYRLALSNQSHCYSTITRLFNRVRWLVYEANYEDSNEIKIV